MEVNKLKRVTWMLLVLRALRDAQFRQLSSISDVPFIKNGSTPIPDLGVLSLYSFQRG